MSRKLMMNNYSENGLTPVMDGLVCWLDGRDGSGTDTVWKDRSGNSNNFEVINCQWSETALKTHTTSSYFNLKKTLIHNGGDFTFDIYFSQNEYQAGAVRILNVNERNEWNRGINFFIQQSNQIFYYQSSFGTFPFEITKRYHITATRTSGNMLNIYINGELVLNKTCYDVALMVLGNGDWNNSIMLGEYYSFKLYNRALTAEEIQQNYKYEQSIKRGE